VIPRLMTEPRRGTAFDKEADRERNRIKDLIARPKRRRAIATRHDNQEPGAPLLGFSGDFRESLMGTGADGAFKPTLRCGYGWLAGDALPLSSQSLHSVRTNSTMRLFRAT
jgi:hypothetical protein